MVPRALPGLDAAALSLATPTPAPTPTPTPPKVTSVPPAAAPAPEAGCADASGDRGVICVVLLAKLSKELKELPLPRRLLDRFKLKL